MSHSHAQGHAPVVIALVGNVIVTVIKSVAAAVSGSSVMFSEAVHSFADSLNQMLLLIGLRRSTKRADESHEYGYGIERFFFGLISACGIFFIGAGVNAVHGFEAMVHPETVEISPMIFVVLAVSACVESYALYAAARELSTAYPKLSWRERIERSDSSTLAVLLEDSVAVFGIFVAAGSIAMAELTGNGRWDGAGSLVIAALLGVVAVVLIQKNRSYVIGRAMPEEMRDGVLEILNAEPSIEKVTEFRSSEIGLCVYRIKCDVEFNGSALARELFEDWSVAEQFEEARESEESFKRAMIDSLDRIPRLIGQRIDEIESRVRERFPEIQHIDIEIN